MEALQNKKILLIEDEFSLRELYVIAFKEKGVDIDFADDGEVGLKKIEENKYDLILLDIMLPKITGIDILRKVKSDKSTYKDIPIIMLTNLKNDEIAKEALEKGAVGYIIKANALPDDVVFQVNKFFETGVVDNNFMY